MTEIENRNVRDYLGAVRRGLRGLPKPDVDDTIEEMRTHIFEEIGERGDAAAVLADFGSAAEVASEIVERRLRPEDEHAVPIASLGLRYSAWATDVVIGFGPLLLIPTLLSFPFAGPLFGGTVVAPIWVLLVGLVLQTWVMSPAEQAQTGSALAVPAWQWVMLAVLLAWAAFYWLVLRRRDSSSAGMWMTRLRAVRVDDDRLVVRERDISQRRIALGAGRKRWWILLAAVPTGCLCILLALYYVSFLVGSFLQPWDNWSRPFEQRVDNERGRKLISEFVSAVNAGDGEAARALCDGVDEAAIAGLLASKSQRGFSGVPEAIDAQGGYIIYEEDVLNGENRLRETYVRVEKNSTTSANNYTDSYRISEIAPADEMAEVRSP